MDSKGTDRLLAALGVPRPTPYAVTLRHDHGRHTLIVRASTPQQAARAACEGCPLGSIVGVRATVEQDAPLAILGPGGDFVREVRP